MLKIDIGLKRSGLHVDTATTIIVDDKNYNSNRLITTAKKALYNAILLCKPGTPLIALATAIEKTVKNAGYSLSRQLGGHMIGENLHEPPFIANRIEDATPFILEENMVLCIEPMVLEGKDKLEVMPDGWTIKTKDNKLAAHTEHTILVTPDGGEVLTKC